MTQPKKKKVRSKIKFRQSAKIVHKNDATRVARPDTTGMRKAPTRLASDAGANFRIKIKKK